MSDNPELKALNEISVKVSGMEATQRAQAESIGKLASGIDRLIDKLDKSDDIAREANQRAKSAQKQIDDVKGDIKWLWRTVIASMVTGIVGGAIALLWKGWG